MQLSALVQTTQNKPQLLSKEIHGFIALFPFHVTAQTGLLGWIDGLICQDGLDGCSQIFSCHRNLIAWPTCVELSAIDQCALAIEQEKVGGACSGIGFGYGLGFVVAKGKGE